MLEIKRLNEIIPIDDETIKWIDENQWLRYFTQKQIDDMNPFKITEDLEDE